MSPTLTNALTVAAYFGGTMAIVTILYGIELVVRGVSEWIRGQRRDGTEP